MKFYKVQSEIALRPPRRRRGEKRGITRLKYVGIDYGLARTDLAVSDPEGRLAFPLVTLRLEEYPNRKDFLAALAARITAEEAEAVVMGLPLLDDGTDSLTTRQVRNVTERLKRRVDLPVFYMPELLSSEEAWSDLRDAGLTARKRKAVLDQQAAVRILASFLALPPEQRRPA